MKREHLKVEKRTVLGKSVKNLRRDGILPGNVYGADIKSQAVQADYKEFEKVFKSTGETGLVDLKLDDQTIPVLIHNLATDYRNNILHADFYKVNLKEKITTPVPLVFEGEPKAVAENAGILMTIMSEIEIEALPTELPENIKVDVSHLATVDEQILVSELKAPEGVTIVADGGQVVAKIGELVSKETQEQLEADAAAAEEAATESAEGEAPAEGGSSTENSEEKPAEAPAE